MKQLFQSDTFHVSAFIILLIIASAVYSHQKYIFPYFDYDEYCEEQYEDIIIIHNKDCPICKESDLWFTTKQNKYDILIKKNACFCTECFDKEEIDILEVIYLYNLLRYERSLKINGASKEYIRDKVKQNFKNQDE